MAITKAASCSSIIRRSQLAVSSTNSASDHTDESDETWSPPPPSPVHLTVLSTATPSELARYYHRWRSLFLPADQPSFSLAADIAQYVGSKSITRRFIRNKNRVYMLDLKRLAERNLDAGQLCSRLETHFRSAFAAAGKDISALVVATVTVLRIRPGEGGQLPHYDTSDPRNHTGVLYCTNGGRSTSVAHLLPARRDEVFAANRATATKVPRSLRLRKEDFTVWPCEKGDFVVFDHSVPHHGVTHPADAQENRVAVFVMFSPLWGSGQEYEQIMVTMDD